MPPEQSAGVSLAGGWRLALSPAGACVGPADADRLEGWIDAPVPGTVARALETAGKWAREAPTSLHDQDAWYRLDPPALGRGILRFEGLATIAEVFLGDKLIVVGRSMFEPLETHVDLTGDTPLWVCFRALFPALDRKGPRARWRPFMIDRQGLRLVRTTLLGHMPGWCPPIHIVGPYRPVRFFPEGEPRASEARIDADWDGRAQLCVEVTVTGLASPPALACAGETTAMTVVGPDRYRGRLSPKGAGPWWPHTHGEPELHAVRLQTPTGDLDLGHTGFRRIEADRTGGGFALRVNGAPVFCRGACWIAPDLVEPDRDPASTLQLARDAGFNMVRVSGVGLYPAKAFYDACDRQGLLVWQDFMFANVDYPAGDPEFVDAVRREARAHLTTTQGAPSLAVLCGGSEVFQQAAMMGLPALAWPLFDEVLAQEAADRRPDVAYLPNTPHGGPMPFSPAQGVSHYYGVGAYQRPLEDARRADVRFASECLAFANVPQPETLAAALGAAPVHDPRWKARTPRDRGASWDFEDVRDHYLQRRFEIDPQRLRREDPALYLDLSRAVSGEVMAAVFAEWRRADSPCAGGLVWTLQDLEVGAGWGLIDALGEPKPAWYALRRVLRPIAVTLTDEGLNGLSAHIFNDTNAPADGELRLTAFSSDSVVLDVSSPIEVPARSAREVTAFDLIGRFFDIGYAYRFGPRAHEAVRAALLVDGRVVAEATHFLGPASGLDPSPVSARLERDGDGWSVVLLAARLLRYVHIADAGWRPQDDGFPLLPGEPHLVKLLPLKDSRDGPAGQVLGAGGHLLASYGAH